MKKVLVLVVVLAVVAAGNVFAQVPELKFSVGGGGYFTSDFGGGWKTVNADSKGPYAGGGAFAFFDATFAELSFGFFGAGGDRKNTNSGTTNIFHMSFVGLDISLLGKYPFTLSEHFTLFPLLGIDYRHFVSVKWNGAQSGSAGDQSALWFKFGAGADYAFTEHIFARLGLLYGMRLKNKWERDTIKYYNNSYPNAAIESNLGHGLDIKLAVGYRF